MHPIRALQPFDPLTLLFLAFTRPFSPSPLTPDRRRFATLPPHRELFLFSTYASHGRLSLREPPPDWTW